MARSDARNVNPSLSSDPRDKLLAALNWSYGKLKHSDPYDRRQCVPPTTLWVPIPVRPILCAVWSPAGCYGPGGVSHTRNSA
jgi:hypothetical protein